MGDKSKIEWTDATWNVVSGCTAVSPGCDRCYARRLAKRLPASHAVGHPFSEVVCHPDRLAIPLHWRRPRRVFVCSMGDLFHPDVPFKFISYVMDTIEHAPQHTFQVLTKRPERALAWSNHLRDIDYRFEATAFPRNVWLGVTAEDQQRADERIPLLLQCPAAVRFVSCEPLLGPIDFEHIGNALFDRARAVRHRQYGPSCLNREQAEATTAYPELSWLIAGGESGPGARPMHPEWARGLRDQCKAAGVPFLFKQWGEWSPDMPDDWLFKRNDWKMPYKTAGVVTGEIPHETVSVMYRVGKRVAGRLLDGVTHDEYPEVDR